MKKYQMKERGLFLIIYAMIKEGFRLLDIDPLKINLTEFEDEYDMKLINLYKKVHKLNKMFLTEKIVNFVDTKLKKLDDNLQKECQPLYIGLLVLYLYLKCDMRKDLFVSEVNYKDIKKIIEDHHSEFKISKCTVEKAIELFDTIYPDESGFTFFLRTTERFPFSLIKGENND